MVLAQYGALLALLCMTTYADFAPGSNWACATC